MDMAQWPGKCNILLELHRMHKQRGLSDPCNTCRSSELRCRENLFQQLHRRRGKLPQSTRNQTNSPLQNDQKIKRSDSQLDFQGPVITPATCSPRGPQCHSQPVTASNLSVNIAGNRGVAEVGCALTTITSLTPGPVTAMAVKPVWQSGGANVGPVAPLSAMHQSDPRCSFMNAVIVV